MEDLRIRSLDWGVLIGRAYSVLCALVLPVILCLGVWTRDERYLETAVVLAALGGGLGWLCWWQLREEAWGGGDDA